MSYYTANVKLYEDSTGAIVASRTSLLAFNPNDTVPDATVTANGLLTGGLVTLQSGGGTPTPFTPISREQANAAYAAPAGKTVSTATVLPFYNVKDYGAKGDGSTDDTTAIQAAINAAGTALAPVVYFPAGRYMTSAPLTISVKGTSLVGANRGNFLDPYSPGASCISLLASANCDMVQVAGGTNGVLFRDLSFYGNYLFETLSTTAHGVAFLDGTSGNVTQEPQIINCVFRDIKQDAINIGNYVDAAHIDKVSIYNTGRDGIRVGYADAKITDCVIGHCTGDGIGVRQWTCKISGCDIFGNATGVNIYPGAQYCLVTNSAINGNLQGGVFVGEKGAVVTGCEFHGNSNGSATTYHNVQVSAAATVANCTFGVQGGNLTVGYNIYIGAAVPCTSAGHIFETSSATGNYGGPGVVLDATLGQDRLTSGEETIRRETVTSNASFTSGTLRLSYFTARKTETVAQVRWSTGSTAAGATPTLLRVGIYSEDGATGNLTLVASTTSDTTLLSVANTLYTKALTASFTKQAGIRYAVGCLVVSGATMPSLAGNILSGGMPTEAATTPRLTGQVSGQSDLPSTITAASLAVTSNSFYFALTP